MATRRQAQARGQRGQAVDATDIDIPSDDLPAPDVDDAAEFGAEEDEVEEEEDEEEVEEEEEEEIQDGEIEEELPFPPPGLKEISSLASWTVSTAKPGNGVAALRSPDTALFWQSDGPQPHLLSIHFFKLVSIVHMRIFLDFQSDESYTPTKIQFLAGMGVHDILEFAEMSFEQPTGWIDVDFSNVGPVAEDDDDDDDDDEEADSIDWTKRPVLRAFLVQVKILENHQNGKDTHLRAVQLFARDEAHQPHHQNWTTGGIPPSMIKTLPLGPRAKPTLKQKEPNNIKLASWMMDPDLR